MAINLKDAFDKAVIKYLDQSESSDEDPASHSLAGTPTSPSYPSRHSSSSNQNARNKRSKKSTKKSKVHKPESRTKLKSNEKVDEDEKRSKSIKVAKKKRGKKKGKKARDEDLEEDEEELDDQESDDAISEASAVAPKRRKNVDVNSLLKTKKLPKESAEELKPSSKRANKERHPSKKDTEIVRSAKETKENKKRKEDFEEDYETPVIAKSKSRKIEKKEIEETGILSDNTKKSGSKLKKIAKVEDDSETVFEESNKQSSHVRTKKNRKKEKTNLKTATKADEKSDKSHAKQKDKKSKQKNGEDPKNGELKSRTDSKDVGLESADSKHSHTSKKLSTLSGNRDVDSLDSLKSKISDRKHEEKSRSEREKQRKAVKSDTHGVHSKKVPSNSNTLHDSDKDNTIKRSKSKKTAKENKKTADDAIKKQDPEVSENKKEKKHGRGLGAEESATIQALNQATEKTLHVSCNRILFSFLSLSLFFIETNIQSVHKTIYGVTL